MDLTPLVLRACMPLATPDACTVWAPAFAAAAKEFGLSDDPDELAAWLASMANESGQLHKFEEWSYFTTPPERIAAVFGAAAPSADTIAQWKAGGREAFDRAYFNYMYGQVLGAALGNTNPDDGYTYRGRGPGQITGRRNVAYVSKGTGVDFLSYPEKLSEPVDGARAFAFFFRDTGCAAKAADGTQYGFLSAMKAMNPGLGHDEFVAHHLVRWREVRRGLGIDGEPASTVTLRAVQHAFNALVNEQVLVEDGIMGPRTRSALTAFQSDHGLPATGAPDAATLAALGIAA